MNKWWCKLKERFSKTKNEVNYIDVVCLNCGKKFSGHYCPECGQAVKEFDRPFGFIIYSFLGDFFAFDTRSIKTLFSLLVKPGFLTNEYFEGRRVRYAPPFRIFVFVSFVLFLLLQIYTNKGLHVILEPELNAETQEVAVDSIVTEISNEMISDNENDKSLLVVGNDTIANIGDLKANMKNSRRVINLFDNFADSLEVELAKETNPERKTKLQGYIRVCRSPESAALKILKYISYAFFLLLPIFALILKFVYIRRKQNYIKHLVFSIHIHSFIFLVLIFIIGMFIIWGLKVGTINLYIFLSVPIYIILAMKRFYKQGYIKTILKFIGVSFLYNIIFWIIIIVASLDAINII